MTNHGRGDERLCIASGVSLGIVERIYFLGDMLSANRVADSVVSSGVKVCMEAVSELGPIVTSNSESLWQKGKIYQKLYEELRNA